MSVSPNLSLPFLQPGQAQKHVTLNESLVRLDALVQIGVESRSLQSPPQSPVEGVKYIAASSPEGAWAGMAWQLWAFQDAAWTAFPPMAGWLAWIKDEAALVVWTGTEWGPAASDTSDFASALSAGAFDRIGVNGAVADTTNRASFNVPSMLLNREVDDINLTLNKEASTHDARLDFQTGFSGRALIGLLGDDDFKIKVSADGQGFKTAISVDAHSGDVGFGTTAPRAPLHLAANGGGDDLQPPNPATALIVSATASTTSWAALSIVSGSQGRARLFFGDPDGEIRGVVEYRNESDSLHFHCEGAERMTVGQGLIVGAPTGGDRGIGTINANAVYDDNALLSCYVFDQAIDGAIDVAVWDKKVTGGLSRHEPLRRFRDRIGGPYDPLTLDGYARHWREKRHLSSMPNERAYDPNTGLSAGEWIQRLVETVEIQAVLIEALNQRLTACLY
ncbi:MAG: DUF2793 domain-containing protein [Pseudomonadota bacterium]